MVQVADPVRARAAALDLVQRLRGAGFVAYFAGGCVRDELLGLHPSDYDVATSAKPGEIAALLPQPRFSTHFVGEAFGVTLVKAGDVHVEVATFRSDGTYTDKRRPDAVVFSSPTEDAQRRDFTMNALFLDPLSGEKTPARGGGAVAGTVIDFVGGVADLHAGVLRAVGDPHQRLAEDHLRALRAVRFAARYGMAIEPATAAAITAHAGDLAGVSRERIGEELRRMLTRAGPARAAAMKLLAELKLDVPVFGQAAEREPGAWPALVAVPVGASVGCLLAAAMVDRHGPISDGGGEEAWRSAWGNEIAAAWRERLCLSNDEMHALSGTLATLDLVMVAWEGGSVAGQKRIAARGHFGTAVAAMGGYWPARAAGVRVRVAELEVIGPGIAPTPILTGSELIAAGLKPGPAFKQLLDLVYDAQLEGRVADLAGALELARRVRI